MVPGGDGEGETDGRFGRDALLIRCAGPAQDHVGQPVGVVAPKVRYINDLVQAFAVQRGVDHEARTPR